MKISNKKYAQALYWATKDATKADLKSLLDDFVKLLNAGGVLSQNKKIIVEFEKFYNQQENILKIRIESANKLTAARQEELTKELSVKSGRQVELTTEVKPELLGGAVIWLDDMVIDGSLRGRLENIKELMIKNNS